MFQEIWNDAIIPALVTFSTAALGVVATYAANALRQWAAKQEAEWKATIMHEAAQAAENAVAAINQTLVDDIRAAREDGKLTPDEAMMALNRAKSIAMEQLGRDGMRALEKIAGSNASAVVLLYGLIEAAVKRAKDA